MKLLTVAAIAALSAAPVAACDLRDIPTETWLGNAAIVGDVATTMRCLDTGRCREANPLYGKHPGDKRLIGVGLGRIAVNTGVACFLADRDPAAARLFARVSLVVNGGVFAANLRFVF